MSRSRFFTNSEQCVEIFEPKSSSQQALYLLGMPATVGESNFTKELNSAGIAVLQPHYPGTYDSAGSFAPSAAAEGAIEVQLKVSSGSVHDAKSDTAREVASEIRTLVGYSFGAHVAFRALAQIKPVNLVLISPAISYGSASSGFVGEDISFLEYLRRSRPLTYRLGPEAEWASFFSGKQNNFQVDRNSNLKRVIAIVGEDDDDINIEVLKKEIQELVHRCTPHSAPKISTIVVKGGSHSADTLLSDEVKRVLRELD